ncbi:MAG: DUF1289 domain-containing protein [Piscirickettsiaceae bacterium]|nr:DUF1289 domain-containing protein [Piscirickettsiaceae bacterium]
MSVTSPCVRNCCLDQNDICTGCGRALNEITQWSVSSDSEKKQISLDAKQRCDDREARYGSKYRL